MNACVRSLKPGGVLLKKPRFLTTEVHRVASVSPFANSDRDKREVFQAVSGTTTCENKDAVTGLKLALCRHTHFSQTMPMLMVSEQHISSADASIFRLWLMCQLLRLRLIIFILKPSLIRQNWIIIKSQSFTKKAVIFYCIVQSNI